MTHPFSKMFEKALRVQKAQEKEREGDGVGDNLVLEEAENLRKKGYGTDEIYAVLQKLHHDLVQDEDTEIVGEALDEFSKHIDE